MVFHNMNELLMIPVSFINNKQGSHQSGKSGNSGKILKTFSSQGNQGKTGIFQPKSGEKISDQGTFFPNHF